MNARLVYRNARAAMVRAGIDPSKAILSQSFLRLEVVLSTNKTSYQFGVLVNDQPQGQPARANENRLNLQDAFYTGTVQMFLGLASSAVATDYAPITYPNPRLFSTAGAAQALNNLYNGSLNLTVNNRVITPQWDLLKHLEINQTQQTTTPVAAGIPLDQLNGNTSTAFSCEPNWVLIGSKNNNLTANLPAAVGTLQAGATTVMTLILRGILAQNVTTVT